MKIARILAALAGILTLGVLAVTAFGQDNTVWLCANKEILNVSERCLTDSESLEAFVLWDLTADSEVQCVAGSITDEGWVGPDSEDETTEVNFVASTTNCKPTSKALNLKEEEATNVCQSVVSPGIVAVDLPWQTLILLKAGIAYEEIGESSGHGEPGYEVTCKTALGNVTDKCLKTAEGNDLPLDNLVGSATEVPLVDVLFPFKPVNSNSERAKCSVGGAESGAFEGEILLEALTNNGVPLSLEVSDVNEA